MDDVIFNKGDFMLKIVFKNMKPSRMARDYVLGKMSPILDKFPSLNDHNVTLTLEMENSPRLPGEDSYSVASVISGKKFKFMRLKKTSNNFYVAASEMIESLHEVLGRLSKKINS